MLFSAQVCRIQRTSESRSFQKHPSWDYMQQSGSQRIPSASLIQWHVRASVVWILIHVDLEKIPLCDLPDLVTVDLGTDYFCGHKKEDQTLQAITCIPNTYDTKLAHKTHHEGRKNMGLSASVDTLWYIITFFHLLYFLIVFHTLSSLGARLKLFLQ